MHRPARQMAPGSAAGAVTSATARRQARFTRAALHLFPMAAAVGVAILLGAAISAALSVPLDRVIHTLLSRFGPYAWGQVLFNATFLTFTGLSVAIVFRAGLFNIGAEGQAVAGSLACALAGIATAGWPAPLSLAVAILAAFAGGALWGVIPGALKARFGTHEVINTIMLNFIAIALSNFLMARYLALPESVRTAEVPAALPRLDAWIPAMKGSAANASLLVAWGAALAGFWFLHHTPAGFELRAVGQGLRQAGSAGIRAGRHLVLAFALGGGLAGLVGTNFVLGYKHYYEDGFTGGIGYLGIAVALIARNEPLAVFPAALLFGFLSQAGLTVNTLLPREVVEILTGVILLVFIVAERRRQKGLRARGGM